MLGLIMPFLAKIVVGWLNGRAKTQMVGTVADAAVDVAMIKGFVEATKEAKEIRKADQQSLWTAWMLPSAFGLCMLHFGAIVLDSLPLFGHIIGSWRIPPLPGRYLEVEITIILSAAGVIGVQSVAGVLRRFVSKA